MEGYNWRDAQVFGKSNYQPVALWRALLLFLVALIVVSIFVQVYLIMSSCPSLSTTKEIVKLEKIYHILYVPAFK